MAHYTVEGFCGPDRASGSIRTTYAIYSRHTQCNKNSKPAPLIPRLP
jgi:hypothetical protein